MDLTKMNLEIAKTLAEQPLGTNPFDFGLRPLIGGKAEELNISRASEILRLAVDLVGPDTFKGLILQLYKLEADRRPPTADMKSINNALQSALEKISKCADAELTANAITIGDSWYNLGLGKRMVCDYIVAAECQWKAAGYYSLGGRQDKMWSSLFLVVVERSTATVVETGDEAEITKAFNALICIRDTVEYLFPGDKMPGWLKGNRQPHCLLAAIWADKEYPQMRGDTEILLNSGKDNHLTGLAKVVAASTGSTTSTAERVAETYWDFPNSSTGNGVLSALLLGAKYANDADKRRFYERVLTWTGSDGAAPMAIAKRMLAKLEA